MMLKRFSLISKWSNKRMWQFIASLISKEITSILPRFFLEEGSQMEKLITKKHFIYCFSWRAQYSRMAVLLDVLRKALKSVFLCLFRILRHKYVNNYKKICQLEILGFIFLIMRFWRGIFLFLKVQFPYLSMGFIKMGIFR